MKRSEFLKVMGLTAVGAAFAPSILAKGKQTNNVSRIATDIKDLKANVNRPITFLVLGAGNRGSVYAGYAKKYPDCMKIVGVADKNQLRLKSMVKLWSTSDLGRQCLRKSHRLSTTDNTATSSKVDIVIRRLVSQFDTNLFAKTGVIAHSYFGPL